MLKKQDLFQKKAVIFPKIQIIAGKNEHRLKPADYFAIEDVVTDKRVILL